MNRQACTSTTCTSESCTTHGPTLKEKAAGAAERAAAATGDKARELQVHTFKSSHRPPLSFDFTTSSSISSLSPTTTPLSPLPQITPPPAGSSYGVGAEGPLSAPAAKMRPHSSLDGHIPHEPLRTIIAAMLPSSSSSSSTITVAESITPPALVSISGSDV
jgi:hypothetical protein